MKHNQMSGSEGRFFPQGAASLGLFWVAAVALALVAFGTSAKAQIYRISEPPQLLFIETKEFLQTGPENLEFEGGSLSVLLNDGDFKIAGCIGNGGTSIMTPNLFCPLGTTAFILQGDVDSDGEADTRSFWSIFDVVRARWIAPGFANGLEGIRISAADANSSLRGEILDASDNGITLWYNVLDLPTQTTWDITRYQLGKEYNPTQLESMYDDIPPGIYQFEFPSLNNPGWFEYINVRRRVFIEGWPGPSPVTGMGAFRMTNDFVGEVLEFDPRFLVEFTWMGISSGSGSSAATVVSADRLYFSLRNASTDQIVYPPYAVDTPDADRAPAWLEGALYDGGVSIGPFFQLGFFDPGEEVIAQLEVRRGLPSGGGLTSGVEAHDYSERIFKTRVRFIDTYEGFAITAYPPGSTEAEIADGFDFDGDGFTNLEEFAYRTDPSLPQDNPSQLVLPRIVDDHCLLVIQKRPFTSNRLDYFAETSTDDGVTWQRVTPANPDWDIVFDNDEVLQVTSTSSSSATSCRIRARVTN
jgi:hypothetical protein